MAFLPLKNFALSLSGGGFRAAAFHLGTLSFLDSLSFKFSDEEETVPDSFLHRIEILSTISGGTITGMIFADAYLNDAGFKHGFTKLYGLLEADKLVDTALEKLNSSDKWSDPNRTRNLINAFADVYNQEFFGQQTFQLFQEKPDKDLVFVFNATEFSSGLAFRFQNTGFFGNSNFRIPSDAAACIRMGDIVAASSCFPMGFEPMNFPKDFCDAGPNALTATLVRKVWRPTCCYGRWHYRQSGH
jgi:predicted acylesterase/phospholipase RssA